MKNSWVALLLLAFSVSAFSQKGSITGNVIDGATKQPVDFAVIALLSAKDSSAVTGTMTEPGGKFALHNINFGNYIVKITFIGYDKKHINVSLSLSNPDVKLSNTMLNVSSVNLQTVTVTGEKPMIENKIDRKVFNVGESVMASTGTATDILKQVPSVSVDIDGNVSLRGNENVVILVNGKPSALSGSNRAEILQQMPANMIENIEIITNPSAKYDPDGVTGIININLKKNVKMGMNGSTTVNAGTKNKYNGNISLNYNTGKLNISGQYSGRYNERKGWGRSAKESYQSNLSSRQRDTSFDTDYSHMGRFGLDYSLTDKISIGYLGSALIRGETDHDITWSDKWNTISLMDTNIYKENYENGRGNNFDNNLFLNKKFDRKGQELKASFTRSDSRRNYKTDLSQETYYPFSDTLNQRNKSDNANSMTTFQLDYTHPFSEKLSMETGWKSTYDNIENNYLLDSLINNTWVESRELSSIFKYKSQVHAGYATFKQEMGSFGYQAGLRGEYFGRYFELPRTGESHSRDFYNIYPTLHLQQKLNDKNELQLSYSRRVFRPSARDLDPTVHYYNANMRSRGNPDLHPEYVNSVELGHLLKWKKNSITSNIFYRQTVNRIERNTNVIGDITEMTYKNIGKANAYGVDVTAIYYLAKWWFLNANSSVFNYVIESTGKEKMNYNFKMISNIFIPNVINFQLSGSYRSGMITTQGEMKPFYTVDAGMRKDVLKGKGTIILNVSDIFNTMQFGMISSEPAVFSQDVLRKRESRILYLGFTYRFGQTSQQQKSKQERPDQNPDDLNQMNNMF